MSRARNFQEAHQDVAVVGGGLQGCLVALALLEREPGARVTVVEGGSVLGGNHTWCFHADDVGGAVPAWLEPALSWRWSAHHVHFPGRSRQLTAPYAGVASERLAAVTAAALARTGNTLLLDTRVEELDATGVTLASGSRLPARLVVDARGPGRFVATARDGAPSRGSRGVPGGIAWQKFVGLEFEVEEGSAPEHPTLMDARVPQTDGFRFFYVLPLSPRRVLVEDTYFSDHAELDIPALRAEVHAHAAALGLRVTGVAREESGCLPLPTMTAPPHPSAGPLRAGYGGGWFHPTTGYSFPVAVRVAEHVAAHRQDPFGPAFARLVREHQRQARFAAFLNRLLFGAFAPEDRWNVLERFYALPEPTIRRFYALQTTATDRARILCGRPPRGLSWDVARERGLFA